MTSNIGADRFKNESTVGFFSQGDDGSLQKRLTKHFKDEFINRIDEVILFDPLSIESLKKIAKAKLEELKLRIEKKNIMIDIDESVYDFLAIRGTQRGFGARPLNRLIQARIENEIADMIVNKKINSEDMLKITADEDQIKISKAEKAMLK